MTKKQLTKQLEEWTVIGPIPSPMAVDRWIPMELDAATHVPGRMTRINNNKVSTHKLKADNGLLDFRSCFGNLSGEPQCFAMAEFTTSEAGKLIITYDVDYWAICWIDGREVHATRDGNMGAFGDVRHLITTTLPAGKHIITLRVVSGVGGWAVKFQIEGLQIAGKQTDVTDEFREDRDARWRDYTRSVVRAENRPAPNGTCGGMPTERFETLMANLGVDARWIAVVNNGLGAYYKSAFIPMCKDALPEYEQQLIKWVDILHARRITAMSWYALCYCNPGWEQHPEWRQQFLVKPHATEYSKSCCCINTPYGEAVINFTIEALKKFNLDGFWFDGSAFSNIWGSSPMISCVCPYCRKKFKAATGLDLPRQYDWSSRAFRRWVAWRYDVFAAYWQRLADSVHAKIPQAAIVFNHYHREGVSWNGGIPLKRFGHGFISGTEADGEPLRGAFYTRMMRAYGRDHTEVWMGLGGTVRKTPRGLMHNPRTIMDFTIACHTAGGFASVGGAVEVESPILGRMADELKPRAPWTNLSTRPYIALHVSQQTETFVFGRNPAFIRHGWEDHYFRSVVGWHHLLAHAGLWCDVVFDNDLSSAGLAKYPLLLMPLAQALDDRQYREVLNYARRGGIVIAGPWFGVCDPEGESRSAPLGDRKAFPFGTRFPSWDELAAIAGTEVVVDGKNGKSQTRNIRLLHVLSPGARIECSAAGFKKIMKRTRVGKGWVVQFGADAGGLFRLMQDPALLAVMKKMITGLAMPVVDCSGGDDDLILGVFQKDRMTTVIHVQQFLPPWKVEASKAPKPPARWGVCLRWRGPQPRAARCLLPEPGPALPVRRGKDGWEMELPPFTWGQVVAIDCGR